MNTKFEDVVKNVESNNVESTSNEQRQTNKPIIVSRRRLLRAGVAGIPVVLTMAGVAPGQFGGVASAASGLDYDKKNTLGRFSSIHDKVLKNNLIYSDEDGFILKNNDEGYYDVVCTNNAVEPTSTGSGVTPSISLTIDSVSGTPAPDDPGPKSSDLTFNLTFNEGAITYPARLNKNGNYYTQQNWFTIDKEKIVAALSSSNSRYTIAGIDADDVTVTIGDLSTTDWSNVHEPWKVVPSEPKQVSVTYSATTSYTYTYTYTGGDNEEQSVTYSGPITISLTFPATVAIPPLTFEKETNW